MRRRNGTSEDPNVGRELAAVDAALAGRPVDSELAELAELAHAIRAERPRPRPGFSAALDAQVRQGFRAHELRTPALQPKRRSRFLPLAAGTAATVFIVATAIVSSGVLSTDQGQDGGGGGQPPSSTDAVETAGPRPAQRRRGAPLGATEGARAGAQAPARGTEGGAADSPAEPATGLPVPPSGVAPRERTRRVERDASLTLATPSKKVEDVADGVIRVTDRYQGFVLRSTVSGGDRSGAGASLDLRIPSNRLQPALRDLSELAHVRSRTQSTQDITARFVSARSRLSDALTERRALLRQLARALTPNETASIRARLRLAGRQIAAARSSLRGLRNRVDFSTVAVAVEADDSLSAGDGGWTPAEAIDDALGVLGVAAAIALVSLAVLVPIAALAFIGLLGYRRIVRARRERVLEP